MQKRRNALKTLTGHKCFHAHPVRHPEQVLSGLRSTNPEKIQLCETRERETMVASSRKKVETSQHLPQLISCHLMCVLGSSVFCSRNHLRPVVFRHINNGESVFVESEADLKGKGPETSTPVVFV